MGGYYLITINSQRRLSKPTFLTNPKIEVVLDKFLKLSGDVNVDVLMETWFYTKPRWKRWEVVDSH